VGMYHPYPGWKLYTAHFLPGKFKEKNIQQSILTINIAKTIK